MEDTTSLDNSQNTAKQNKPLRIGGVLILVAIGLVISLIQNLGLCSTSLRIVFDNSIWDNVTDPNSPAYHSYWKPVLLYEAVSSIVLLLLNAAMLALFFGKKRVFPKLMVILIPTFFALMLIGYYLSGFIPVVAESADHTKQGQYLIIRFIALHVWIPYFLLSDRVKKTFVR